MIVRNSWDQSPLNQGLGGVRLGSEPRGASADEATLEQTDDPIEGKGAPGSAPAEAFAGAGADRREVQRLGGDLTALRGAGPFRPSGPPSVAAKRGIPALSQSIRFAALPR